MRAGLISALRSTSGAFLLWACTECHSSSGGQAAPSVLPSASAVPSAVPSASGLTSSPECAPICSAYWLHAYRFDRLCGGGAHLFDSLWATPACSAAEVQRNDSLRFVDRRGKGKEDRPLCRCGEELPHRPVDKRQVSGARCESLCQRAEGLWARMDRECQAAPTRSDYNAPQCYDLEERFFELRPEIFACWCTRISRSQRMLHGTPP